MIIHLAGSSRNIDKDYSLYRAIVAAIAACGGSLARDWIEPAHKTHSLKEGADWKSTVADTLSAISQADLVIIEASAGEYLQGYETAVAVQQKKPTLVVSRHKASKTPASGLRNRLLTTAHYRSEEDLSQIVKDFIIANTIATKDLRFNMFIDRPIYNFLRSVSYETGKNKSEIIRELINREINKQKD